MESQGNMDIKSISSSDGWTDKQIQTLSYGGNSRMEEFLQPYLIALSKDKYSMNIFNLKATEFYSKRLLAFSNTGYFDQPPPSVEDGIKLDASNLRKLFSVYNQNNKNSRFGLSTS
jgi:hypothetical protein